ncbi:lipoprotein [Listeria sp. FSL L7-1485]|uniref:Lipoprotein n=1 Tax=Listeria immobilis TaxID=2713502 RepID=A0A7X1CA44_9LIST|nr:lipoprotein [Listeria immobilis]MBC1490024.1 lipoprotein [Listeria immobilis]MBC1537152.1 lipoprotein [Listeria immobilis]
MKKTISVIILLLILTACSNSNTKKESIVEASGTIEKVESASVLIKNFKDKLTDIIPEEGIEIYFNVADKYYNEEGKKIKITEMKRNDKVTIELIEGYEIQETSPAEIDLKYVKKIIKLND